MKELSPLAQKYKDAFDGRLIVFDIDGLLLLLVFNIRNFMVVLETKDRVVLVADGKKRSIKRPKRKNLKHISLTQSVIPEEQLFTNKSIRHALSQLNANTCQGEI